MECNKRIFTFKEFCKTAFIAFERPGDLMCAKKAGEVTKTLQNHIMLAVTEVNGCALCAYAHTKNALIMGMAEADIEKLLSGGFDHLDADEAVALAFAQHYAEVRSAYDKKAWRRVTDTYGQVKADGVMAAIRMIMFGNAYGIAAGALWRRISGRRVKNSRFTDEILITLLGLLVMPAALVRGLFVKKSI